VQKKKQTFDLRRLIADSAYEIFVIKCKNGGAIEPRVYIPRTLMARDLFRSRFRHVRRRQSWTILVFEMARLLQARSPHGFILCS
jgi:hypothetical protein